MFPSRSVTLRPVSTNRRTFLAQSAKTAAALCLLTKPRSAASKDTEHGPDLKFPTTPKERICVASYPFREFISGPEAKAGATPPMDLKDFAAHAKERFTIDKIEPWSGHFPSTDPKYIEQFRLTVDRAQCYIVNIAVDGESSPYAADSTQRAKAVDFSKRWIDIAAAINSPSIRTNMPATSDSAPDINRAADSLRRVADYAAEKRVLVNLENDNPVSEDPFFIVSVVEKVNNPWLHALPDFANTLASAKDPEHAYAGVDAMFAHAYSICHVKDAETKKDGQLIKVDMTRTFASLKKHGYKGYCSMEWDRPGDPYEGTASLINTTIQMLK
jgi:sugar phosphate isomerase/epimerase